MLLPYTDYSLVSELLKNEADQVIPWNMLPV